jgi:hypothetical protein
MPAGLLPMCRDLDGEQTDTLCLSELSSSSAETLRPRLACLAPTVLDLRRLIWPWADRRLNAGVRFCVKTPICNSNGSTGIRKDGIITVSMGFSSDLFTLLLYSLSRLFGIWLVPVCSPECGLLPLDGKTTAELILGDRRTTER